MLMWEELPSAQATEAQAIFVYDERCRMAGELVQASARQTALGFAFRRAPGYQRPRPDSGAPELAASQQVTTIVSDMAAGLRLIYTSPPVRLRHLANRLREQDGLLPRQASRPQSMPDYRAASAQVRLALRQASADTASLGRALARSGERFSASESVVSGSTGIWRIGIALATLLQSGRALSLDALLGNGSNASDGHGGNDVLAAANLARSIIRPDDWSSRQPVRMADLAIFSGEIELHLTGALSNIVRDMQNDGITDSAARALLDRKRVPAWLLSRVLKDNPSPWRKQ